MVLNYLSTDTLEEVPTINNYKKLTWYVLVVQIIVTVLYHFGRTGGSGIYYLWTWPDYGDARYECKRLDYDSTNPKWTKYHCDDYFKIFYSDSAYNYYYDFYDRTKINEYKKYYNTHWKCKSIRNQNNDVYTNYSNWINDGCEDYFSSPDVDYYCYIDDQDGISECNNTATYTCNYNNTNHSFYDDACSCKDYVLDASQWYKFYCNKEYNNENWYPSYAGISFPWVGGMWFVLAVWTTALPQEFKDCVSYTLISLIINIAADTVNTVYYFRKTTYTLVGFSFIIVFPCLTLMKKAFQKLELSTKEKDVINLRTIALHKIRTIFLIGLAQLYISLPAYQHTFEQSLGEQEDETNTKNDSEWWEDNLDRDVPLLRHLIPIATGGIFNVAYVVSILFVDITRLHFVDVLNGDTYNLEFLIGALQVIGFALTLALNALQLPTKEDVVLEEVDPTEETNIPYVISTQYPDSASDQYYMIENIYWSTIVCIGAIWIFIIFLVAHVKNDGSYMKYFENRWLKREAATTMGIRKELIKNHSIIKKDELIQLKKFITNELEKLLIEITNFFSDGINKKLFNDLLKTLHNEIYTTINDTILPIQSIQAFGMLTSKQDLMEQWYNLSSHKVKKPLKKLKSKIIEHLTNEKNKSDKRRIFLAENLTIQSQWEIPSITDNWTRLFCEAENLVEERMKMIEDDTNKRMDTIKTNVQIASKNLRAIILKNNTNSIEVSKEFEEALVDLEIYTQQEVNNLWTYILKQCSDGPYKKIFYNLFQQIKTKFNIIVTENISSDKSMLEIFDLSSTTNYDEQFEVLINKTFKNPLTTLKKNIIDHIIDHIHKRKESYGPQQLENLLSLSNDIKEKIDNVIAATDNKGIEIKRQFNMKLQQDEEGQTGNKTTVNSQENEQLQDETCERKVNDTMGDVMTSNKILEQHLRDDAQVNKLKLKKMRLQQDNEIQTVNETKAFFNKTLEEQINQLIQVNMGFQEDNKEIQEDNIQLKKDFKEIQGDNNNLQKDIKEIQEDNIQLKKDNIQLKKDIKEIQRDNNNLQKDIKEIQEDNIQLKKDNKKLQKDNKVLKEKLENELKNIYIVLEKHNIKF